MRTVGLVLRLLSLRPPRTREQFGGSMKLNVTSRNAAKKSESNQLRRSGAIPAVIYSKSGSSENIAIDAKEFSTLLRQVKPGHLATTRFELELAGSKSRPAIVKDIQYNPVNYDVVHIDFEILDDKHEINVNVPIECIGAMDCVGVKLGGVVRQVIRGLKVRCFPKDLPESFKLDIRNMSMRDCKRLKDLEIPNTVRPLVDLNEVVVVIAKR